MDCICVDKSGGNSKKQIPIKYVWTNKMWNEKVGVNTHSLDKAIKSALSQNIILQLV